MKTVLILGAGTSGTMAAVQLSKKLDLNEWQIVIVDRDQTHYYQPSFLFIPFGLNKPQDAVKPKKQFLPRNVSWIQSDAEQIEPENNRVRLSNGAVLTYDYLVVATGTFPRPDQTDGMLDGGWRKNVHEFYTFEGSKALAETLKTWTGGRLVVHITELPIKCPVAPLEFAFLADDFFRRKGLRNKVDLMYVTPLSGAFTKARTNQLLTPMLADKAIQVETDFAIMEVDSGRNMIRSFDDREIAYDLLVTVPVNMGAAVVEQSGMGNDLNYVPTHKNTLQSKQWPNVFVVGDASDIPTSKAGSVAHYQMEAVVENMLAAMHGRELHASFDGHTNCFIESGRGKGLLIDFNYDVEPLPGMYPVPVLGPFPLLKESFLNHWGKLFFRWMYWNLLLKGVELPLPSNMTMAGKKP
jgi:sulfide:quinone oxidoreductase